MNSNKKSTMITKCGKRVLGLFLTVMLLLSANPAIANDGTYYTKGNHLVPLTETDISVRKEVLTISIMDNGYARVDVYYEFWNPGNTTKNLLMGFEADPPYNDDYKFHSDGIHPNIKDFTVEMNGQTLSYRNAPCRTDVNTMTRIDVSKRYYVYDNNELYEVGNGNMERGPNDVNAGIPFAYVYYFNAEFQPGLNRVHHTYTYRMSIIVGTPYSIEYKLTPAGRWAGGKIDDFTLIIRADKTAKHFLVYDKSFNGAKFTVAEGAGKVRSVNRSGISKQEVSLRNGAIKLHLANFHPEDELYINAVGVYECTDDNGVYHFGGFYERSSSMGLWVLQSETADVYPSDRAFLRRIARNLPYANRGHVFKDARLRKFFMSQWWYMPDPKYKDSDSDFTDVDREYINADF